MIFKKFKKFIRGFTLLIRMCKRNRMNYIYRQWRGVDTFLPACDVKDFVILIRDCRKVNKLDSSMIESMKLVDKFLMKNINKICSEFDKDKGTCPIKFEFKRYSALDKVINNKDYINKLKEIAYA